VSTAAGRPEAASPTSPTAVLAPGARVLELAPDPHAQLDRQRARQHGVAALGRLAQAGAEIEALVATASDLLRELTDADRAVTLRPGATQLPAEAAILRAGELPPAWRELGAACALIAPIGDLDGGARAIAALQLADRGFDADELDFASALGHVLAAAIHRRAQDEQMRRHALLDPLTGLPNRSLFLERVRNALHDRGLAGPATAVLVVGLDRFKLINDALGHERGDELLQRVGERLERAARPEDTLARLGGDEFALLCRDVASERDAIACAARMLAVLERPITLHDRDVAVSASAGIALAEPGSRTAGTLVRDADVAMYAAKEQGGGRLELFNQAVRTRMIERITLEQDLRTALDQDQFELYYQPIVSLDHQRVVGVEALLRWNHPQHGLVAPSAFIPVAEASGLIVPLGRWVLLEACRQAARWEMDDRLGDAYVSVNLSGRQLTDPGFPAELGGILDRTGLAAHRLVLEVTESVLMEETSAPTAVLQRIKESGVRLMLDDFGTGYSSLNYVKRFPVEAIKVDRSFVASVAREESDRHILAAIASMAAALDVEVIAEGVEEAEQARWLRHLGITLAQGYGFARPAPASAIEPLLRDGLPLDRLAPAFARLSAAEVPEAARADAPQPARLPDPGATVTLGEAAQALDVSTSTLRRWADTGRIRSLRTSGGHRRFPVAEVRRLSASALAGQPAAVRVPPLPAAPLDALAALIDEHAEGLAAAGTRALYQPDRPGWFATPAAAEPLRSWLSDLAASARSGAWVDALQSTRRLVAQANYAGTSLEERQALVERVGDALVRAAGDRGLARREVIDARRLFANLRRLAVEAAEPPASGR
jgi:diguanylate cyclase (GGDEF)-like protein/excisionase family DNA binding protein